MKNLIYLFTISILLVNCTPQEDPISDIGDVPTNPTISIDNSDIYHPVFTANADNAFIYKWDFDNGDSKMGKEATPYLPFEKTYHITCFISGAGGETVIATTDYVVPSTDPNIAHLPVWKELTGEGAGRTWVYNTDPTTGSPSYCYQTTDDLETYPDGWTVGWGWGQCVQITPDINGSMEFDLNGGLNYVYHHIDGDSGVQGTFQLNTQDMTITITSPYILDHDIDCTTPTVTAQGIYHIMLLTDTEMVLWQNQENGTGWSWSFKVKP